MLSLTMKNSGIDARLVRRDPNYCLVVDFENSVPPMVWHCDLERVSSFTLLVRGSGDDWALGLVEHKGEFVSVARFDSREDAEDAFESVQKALVHRPSGQNHVWLRWFAVLLIAAALFSGMSLLGSKTQDDTAKPSSAEMDVQPEADQKGVPLSADEFLQGR